MYEGEKEERTYGPEKHEIHTQFALVINDMMKHAGCATVLELRYLVPGA